MVDPRWTAIYNTPNKSIRQNVARRGVVLHHAATTSLDALRRLAMGGKQVSATALVKDGNRERLMTDEFRAWSLSDAYWDSACRSVETANESTNGWTISDESTWSLALLVAYWAERDGFWPHRNGPRREWTVYGHREIYEEFGASYATACPGGMDLNLVTKRAQEILRGHKPQPEPTPEPIVIPEIEEDDMKIAFGHRSEGNDEWMLVHPDLEGGYMVTVAYEEALAWSRVFKNGWDADLNERYDFNVKRSDYIAIQEAAKRVASAKIR